MKHRVNWKECLSYLSANFRWKDVSAGIDFNSYSRGSDVKCMVNHYEFHSQISNKQNLFLNLMAYCEKNNIQIFKFLPLTVILYYNSINFGSSFNNFCEFHRQIDDIIFDVDCIKTTRNSKIKRYCSLFEIRNSSNKLLGSKTICFIPPAQYFGKNLWLIKAVDLNRGRGIKLCWTLDSLEKYIKQFYDGFNLEISKHLDESEKLNSADKVGESDEEETRKYLKKKNGKAMEKCQLDKARRTSISQQCEDITEVPIKSEVPENKIKKFKIIVKLDPPEEKEIKKDLILPEIIDQQASLVTHIQEVNLNPSQEKLPTITPTVVSLPKIHVIKQSKHSKRDKEVKDKAIKKGSESTTTKKKISSTAPYQTSVVIIQKYIEKPFLYNGRKMDLRIWVLITHKMQVYAFKEGHLKTCSFDFNIEDKNAFVHLTNYSFQKNCSNFENYEIGNEVSFNSFQEMLDAQGVNVKVYPDIFNKAKELIKHSMKSVKQKLNFNDRKFCFEIFGYDLMMDTSLNMYLIEVNTNPGIDFSSPMMNIILPRMIEDCLRLTLDDVFETEFENNKYKNPFKLEGYDDDENLWEQVCSLS